MEFMHAARLAETHLELLRMRIHIHQRRVHLQVQHVRAKPPVEQHVLIGKARRARDQLVAHEAAVQKGELQIGLTAREGRQREPPGHAQRLHLVGELDHVRCELLAADLRHPREPLRGRTRRRQRPDALAVVREREADRKPRQREPFQHAQDVLILGRLRPQEFAARRHVEEQIPDFDAGAGRVRGGRWHAGNALARIHVPRMLCVLGARGQRQPGDGGDARQGLAAKSQGRHPLEIRQGRDLAGRVARQGESDLLARDADAVVAHANQAAPSPLELDLDAPCARIQGILNQLLDHGGRALDHLAGGDLVDELIGQYLNGQGTPRERRIFAQRGANEGSTR